MGSASWIWQLGPELILLIGGCLALFLGSMRAARNPSLIPVVSLITIAAALVVSLRSSVHGFEYAVPGLLVSQLTVYTRFVTLSLGLLLVLVNWNQSVNHERGEYLSMVLFSLLGVLLTASANDLVVLFFAIELVSVPTYVLIGLSREDSAAPEATVKYFFLGALSAAILAYGLSFLYGLTGTTTLLVLAGGGVQSPLSSCDLTTGLAAIALLLTFAGLAFKIAAVPFHFYAPDVYQGSASPVSGLLGFVPKMAGFIALVKIFGAVNWALPQPVLWAVWLVALATMVFGTAQALWQTNVKRILAYSSITHSGYMLIALLVGPLWGYGPLKDGVCALLFAMAVYGTMNLGAFAMLTVFRVGDREVEELSDLEGLSERAPGLSLAMAVCVFSLIGFPPLAGFLGKLYIFAGAFSVDSAHAFRGPLIALAIVAALNAAVAATYYLRIVASTYMTTRDGGAKATSPLPARLGLIGCAIIVLLLFAKPGILTEQTAGVGSVPCQDLVPAATPPGDVQASLDSFAD